MPSDMPQPPSPEPPSAKALKGLPAVLPPSGKHIAQMFLVPFLIVSAIVLILGGILWFILAPHPPEYYLKGLRSSNADIRWRTAEELAKVLPNNETLATDTDFALDLTRLLRQWLDENKESSDRGAAGQGQETAAEQAASAKELDERRKSIKFVIQSLGHLYVPVAAPLLAELAQGKGGGDARTIKERRLDAVWALANLGERCKRYPDLPPERRQAIETSLAVAAKESGERGEWAQAALDCLKSRCLPAVDEALAQCAQDPDLMLRKLAAVALTYWEGPHTEATLARLAEQPGGPGEPGSPSVRGLEIRFQATAALAQRGSKEIDSRLSVLGQMLDPDYLGTVLRTRLEEREVADQGAIRSTVSLALQSLVALHQKRPDLDLSKLYPALDKLVNDPNFGDEARSARIALERK